MDKTARQNLTPILLIDEAHLLKTDAITDLRLLVSSPLDSSAHLKIILFGQEHLKYILKETYMPTSLNVSPSISSNLFYLAIKIPLNLRIPELFIMGLSNNISTEILFVQAFYSLSFKLLLKKVQKRLFHTTHTGNSGIARACFNLFRN